MKRSYYVRALWDDEVKRWYSESDIHGLAIETDTLDGFEEVMKDVAAELIIANRLSKEEITSVPAKDWVPTILWERPTDQAA
jgi:hypothetical protein